MNRLLPGTVDKAFAPHCAFARAWFACIRRRPLTRYLDRSLRSEDTAPLVANDRVGRAVKTLVMNKMLVQRDLGRPTLCNAQASGVHSRAVFPPRRLSPVVHRLLRVTHTACRRRVLVDGTNLMRLRRHHVLDARGGPIRRDSHSPTQQVIASGSGMCEPGEPHRDDPGITRWAREAFVTQTATTFDPWTPPHRARCYAQKSSRPHSLVAAQAG